MENRELFVCDFCQGLFTEDIIYKLVLDKGDIMEHIGHIGVVIRSVREQKRISQVELARKSGVADTWLCKIERGKIDPRLSTLKRIANGLGHGHKLWTIIKEWEASYANYS